MRYRSLKICIILVGLAKILAKKSNAYQYSRTDSVAELHIDLPILATGGNPDWEIDDFADSISISSHD